MSEPEKLQQEQRMLKLVPLQHRDAATDILAWYSDALAVCQAEAEVLREAVFEALDRYIAAAEDAAMWAKRNYSSSQDPTVLYLQGVLSSTPTSQAHAERVKLFEEFWSLARPILNAVNPETPVGRVIAKIDALDGVEKNE